LRALGSNEIEILTAARCRAKDWNAVTVCEAFNASKVFNCRFEGSVKLGDSEVSDSTLCDCTIGDGCSVSYVRLLKGYTVEDGCELRNIGELSAKAGYMPQVAPMNENGGRTIGLFRGMTVGDAYLWAKYRGNGGMMEKLQCLAEREAKENPIGYIGEGCEIKNCVCIRNVAVGSNTKIENCTALEDGVIERGCKVENGVIAQRFLLGENVHLENGLRLIDSVVGDNSTLACCEVVSSMIFPGHEQHHNNSFLIAATVKGQSNVAAGATIGSNHNSRTADGEIVAGRGFWPGLCCSFKHSSKFASYCLLAKGDYPYELNIALPFALVNNNVTKNQLEVMPAYWWMYNMYALKRNAVKYKQRDKRVGKRQHIEFEMFAPDTVEEIIAARKLIKIWTEEAYNPALMKVLPPEERQIEIVAQGMENSKRKTVLLKAGKAYKAYGDMLIYYAMSVLVGDGNDRKPQYDAKSYEREKRWHNIGGQLVAEADLKKLIDELSGFQSWDDIHRWMDDRWGGYEEQKRQHAYQVVLDLLLSDEISDEQWKRLTERYEEICKEMEEQAELSRAKDFDNEFRKMTFESEEERKAVIK
jgi:carbonic anhydrase/acetyltransferase-like protein (isoleucine patch superfamily)